MNFHFFCLYHIHELRPQMNLTVVFSLYVSSKKYIKFYTQNMYLSNFLKFLNNLKKEIKIIFFKSTTKKIILAKLNRITNIKVK